jgi:prophage endopeptidase
MSKFTASLIGLLFVMLIGITYYQTRVEKLKHDVAEISKVAKGHQATIDLMTARNKLSAELDIKYAKELADAKSENDRLRADVESGTKRLRVNATCKAPNTSATSSMDDATTAELTPDARQNYFSLREQLATSEKQILGLQEYINRVVFDEKNKSNR